MDGPDEQLEALRRQIDKLDAQLIELLAQRLAQAEAVGRYKHEHDLPALDETRWRQAAEVRLQQARQLGLSGQMVSELFELIHRHALQVEKDLGAK
jgi:chorismate mutase